MIDENKAIAIFLIAITLGLIDGHLDGEQSGYEKGYQAAIDLNTTELEQRTNIPLAYAPGNRFPSPNQSDIIELPKEDLQAE